MSQPERVEVPLLWVGGDELQVIKVNQFIVQVDVGGDVFLTCGTVTPPALLGDNHDDLKKQAERISYVPIRTVSKFALSGRHLRELISVLQTGVEMLERLEAAT
ncbi:MAG: hypothetical protein LC799_11315 [Actinobacteria bacterium]|nr:hypothetical protein [Actinomycetota bacterium]